MTVLEAMNEAASRMAVAGIDDSFWQAKVIAAHVLNRTPAQLVNTGSISFSPGDREIFFSCAARRIAGEPLQYIIGNWDFYGRTFLTRPGTLIPRPETELLVDHVLRRHPRADSRILDAGTGSGIIGITIALELPESTVVGSDLSEKAVALAARNASNLGAANFLPVVCSLADALRGGFDVIAANLPYIPTGDIPALPGEVRNHEPILALDGGEDGISTILELVNCAFDLLNPGGFIVLETGYDQKDAVTGIFDHCLWTSIEAHLDYSGRQRLVTADRRPCGIG